MKRRALASCEAWAIDPRAIQRAGDSIFILFSPDAPPNEYSGGVACVHLRGPLDHHAGYGDNYDAIRERAAEAFADEDTRAVIFRIDSPGGAVSGLIDTVRAIRAMAEASEKPTVAYVDERAFSAAYALACACDEIVIPASGLCGSIGVISTMADQVERDRAQGFNFVTITSGARKSDGHIHVPISEDAVRIEQSRVNRMAEQFFGLVSESRGLSMKAIAGFEAGLFLGKEAVVAGTADRVSTFDRLLDELAEQVAHFGTGANGAPGKQKRAAMVGYRTRLLAQLKEAKRKASAATDAREKAAMQGQVTAYEAALEAYKKVTEKHVEHSKTHEEDDGDEDEKGNETDRGDAEDEDEDRDDADDGDSKDDSKDDSDGDEKKKSARGGSSKRAASARTSARKPDEEDEGDEEDEEEAACEEDEEEAITSPAVQQALAQLKPAERGAMAAILSEHSRLQAKVSRLEKATAKTALDARVDKALGERRITKREAKTLRGESIAYVKAFLDARPVAMFNGDGDERQPIAPHRRDANGATVLPDDLQRQLDAAVMAAAANGIKIDRKAIVEDFDNRQTRRTNGAAPRE